MSAVLDFLRDRKRAFQLTFRNPVEPKSRLFRLTRWAYRWIFGRPAGWMVLADLAKFCRAAESCVVPGHPDKTLLLAGRQEVWLRIQQHIQLAPDELFALYSGKPVQQETKPQ